MTNRAGAAFGSRRLRDRFGYLLKHARARLADLSAEALRDHGVNGREVAVLMVLADGRPPSQLEAAERLGIDRTSMVALLDALEGKGLVERRADAEDRRRNVVQLTVRGQMTLDRALHATDDAERAFLAPLAPAEADRFRTLLQAVIGAGDGTERTMSTEHPDATAYRRTADAFRARDFEALTGLIDEDVVWHVPGTHPRAGEIRGRPALLAWLASLDELAFTLREHDVLATDEHVCALSYMGARRPGVDVETRVVSVFHYRDGQQTERWFYPDDLEAWNRIFDA